MWGIEEGEYIMSSWMSMPTAPSARHEESSVLLMGGGGEVVHVTRGQTRMAKGKDGRCISARKRRGFGTSFGTHDVCGGGCWDTLFRYLCRLRRSLNLGF